MKNKLLALFLLGACQSGGILKPDPVESPTPAPTPTVTPTPVPIPELEPGRQVIEGWIPEYSQFVADTVDTLYPDLLTLPAGRMVSVCPNWASLPREDRLGFWADFVHAVTVPESQTNRTLIYREGTMSTDAVTGYQVRSEGLLQLSYQDRNSYPAAVCKAFDWTKDKAMAKSDYDSGAKYGNPARTILDAYINLGCGLYIMNKHITDYGASKSVEVALGSYWYVINPNHSKAFGQVMSGLKRFNKACF